MSSDTALNYQNKIKRRTKQFKIYYTALRLWFFALITQNISFCCLELFQMLKYFLFHNIFTSNEQGINIYEYDP